MFPLYTWSTWDVRCLNAVMKVPELAEVRLIAYDSKSHQMIEEMRWESLVKLGLHSSDGSYFDIILSVWKNTFELAFTSNNDQFTLRITPLEATSTLRFFVAGMFRWNHPGEIQLSSTTAPCLTMKGLPGEGEFRITTLGIRDGLTSINAAYPGILMDGSRPFYVRCNHEKSMVDMDALLAERKTAWMDASVHGEGWLADAPEAAFKGMIWNTIYDPINSRFCTPVTREWCIIKPERPWFGSYVIFVWDTFLASLLTALQDEKLAYKQLDALLDWMNGSNPTGDHLPLLTSEVSTFAERSQPPVGAFCVLKLFRQFGNVGLLENTFERLLAWHNWWMIHRDGNGDGMLEWGTDLEFYGEEHLPFYLNECRSESGLDNSPMYDGTRYNPQTHTLEIADVGLNSLYALDCWALAEIAGELTRADHARSASSAALTGSNLALRPNLPAIEAGLRAEFEQMKALINDHLWNDALGIYCNRHWNGSMDETLSPTSFYPLLAGIASPQQARRMVEEHLLNPAEFWGEYILPATPRNHPAFKDNNYWRGRIWAPTNFLVGEGLKRYGFDEVSHTFARKSLQLFNAEWQAESHIHENYNAITGDGDDVENADPVYTWGGLLAYMGVCELAEAQAWGGLRFGHLGGIEQNKGEVARLNHLRFADGRYSITMDEGLKIERNGDSLIESDMPILITDFRIAAETVSFNVRSRVPGIIRIYPPAGIKILTINGLPRHAQPIVKYGLG